MILRREKRETWEAEHLAPYATCSCDNRGREYPEEEHPYRTAFQRDRDRILHTTAFRRLEYKTQVFVVYEGDYYRTRLTHTLEVAQIGRTIARALRANEDLVEAISLAHDLGHTPFGHAGEEALHALMADHGGFNHNRQSLRIVEVIEQRYPDFPGLNLTWETREGILKHDTEYDRGGVTRYDPELRATLEGQIVSAADELAYNAHDLDDGLRADILDPMAVVELPLWQEVLGQAGLAPNEPLRDMARHRAIRTLINLEVTALLEETERVLGMVKARSVEDIRGLPENVVGFSAEMREHNRALKEFLFQNLYRHYRVVRMATKASRFIQELFTSYIDQPNQLPTEIQDRIPEEGLYQVVCDYIAGMTDHYALDKYQKLFEPHERM
ncbi:MAG: deoxyguanosinetriphosphate triphosphohydrolase [Chloroflexota bacterium]|nr:deoxyguanosinetriphosphate triphosphohydrolase [Chloroflexota bacterium]